MDSRKRMLYTERESQFYQSLLISVYHQMVTKMKGHYEWLAAGRGLLVNDWHLLSQMAFFLTALSEKRRRILHLSCSSRSVSFCLLELHNSSTFGGHFRLLKLFNIKNIFFPKIHWALSVKSHLSPVKIFPSTAFLYKALITQFAESALETLRSEAWRSFFSLKWRERKGIERREEKQSVKSFHCHVHLAASTRGIQGKKRKTKQKQKGKKKEKVRRKRRQKQEGGVGSGREKQKENRSFILSLGFSRLQYSS